MNRTLVAVCLALLLPAGALAQESQEGFAPEETARPLRAGCAMNLLEIARMLQLHATARDGAFPSRLSELFTDVSGGNSRCLVCPAASPQVVEGGFRPSYSYVEVTPGGRNIADGPDDIVAFDADPVHEGGRNVLFSNFDVAYMKDADFWKMLLRQEQEWNARGKTLNVVLDDFLPLSAGELSTLTAGNASSSFFDSVHFRIALLLALAIIALAAYLVILSRKRKSATGPPPPDAQ